MILSTEDRKLNYSILSEDINAFINSVEKNAVVISTWFPERKRRTRNSQLQAMLKFIIKTDEAGIDRETAAAILRIVPNPELRDIIQPLNASVLKKIVEKSSKNAPAELL